MGNSKTVTASSGEIITVKKLALGDYAALLRCLKNLPAVVGKYFTGEGSDKDAAFDELLADLPEIIAGAIPEVAGILAVVSDKDADWYQKEADLADVVDVFVAGLEINNYQRIIESLKKLTAVRANRTPNPVKN